MSVLNDTLTVKHIAGLPVKRAGDQTPNINMLVYGEYGAGKTLLAGSSDAVPALRNVLMIDIEGGGLTLRHKYPDVEIIRVTTWAKMQEVYDELRAGTLKGKYNTVIIDSLTEAQVFNMDNVMKEMLAKALEKLDETGIERDEDVPSLREWQKNQSQIRKFIRAYRDLPITAVMTALVKDDKNKTTGKVAKRPDLPGKLASQVPALFDEVFYLYVQEVEEGEGEDKKKVEKRCLLTGTVGNIAAKDRSGRLPRVVVEPTMKKLYDLMIGAPK